LPDWFWLILWSFIEKKFLEVWKNFLNKKKFFYKIKKFFYFFYLIENFFLLKIFWKKNISPIEKRICGSDIFYDICKISEQNKFWIYLIWGDLWIPKKVSEKLFKLFPKLKILWTFDWKFWNEKKILELEKNLLKTNPKIIFVAMWAPKQEILIKKFLKLNKKILFWIWIWGTFDFVIWKQKRAPKILQKLGLEWLFRLFKEPKRIWRIWNAIFGYLKIVFDKV
jgi:N-acetylglucosaminyldiphosphoundecaprenol N-acetyl-beta-D-mannosaminyltransferase